MSRRMVAFLAATTAVGIAAPVAVSSASAATSHPRDSGGVVARQVPSPQQIRSLFDGWNRALATRDPQRVADRYASDAVLLPTVSNQVRADRAAIVDYFSHFLLNSPQAVIVESHVNVLDATTAVDSGIYRFTLNGPEGRRIVDARYTYVYELRHGRWLIVVHHSSAMPE
ncbi:SgcJ/EcaC family oxidoreductase [Actinoplanes sp. NPDC026670]|uniref:SgcJ/EcaC family oxidoreductase n=1 Tax=Actinoplanes sp. NPDC026670 TaxID=3154700 RepID=UPI0033F6F8E5